MSLTSENLIGYLRAEFHKSGRIRVWLFFVQLLSAVPAAVSVFVPDHEKILIYALATAGVLLLVGWWILNWFYLKTRSAANAARRGALLLGGLQQPLSPSEIQILRERFTVTSQCAQNHEKVDYYATKEPHGPARLAEMIEESALYSEYLQRKSANVMGGILLIFVISFILISLASIPTIEQDTGMVIARVILALMVFLLSADVIGAWSSHSAAAGEIKQIRYRLMVADRAKYPMTDVLLAFADYNSAIEGCPESVPFVYKWDQQVLEQRWADYQRDRLAARAQWKGTSQ